MIARRSPWLGSTRCVLLLALLLCASWTSGCATSRGELDVRVPCPGNPAQGPAVVIRSITDSRVFEAKPSVPSTPSLKNESDLEKPEIKARAIARKRNTWGKALGDILLPEGRTASDVTRESVTSALQRSGYRVLQAGEAGSEGAAPVDVGILELWAWSTPGFWAVAVEFKGRLSIQAPIAGFGTGREFEGYVELHTQGASTHAWRNTINKGLEILVTEIAKALPAVPEP